MVSGSSVDSTVVSGSSVNSTVVSGSSVDIIGEFLGALFFFLNEQINVAKMAVLFD